MTTQQTSPIYTVYINLNTHIAQLILGSSLSLYKWHHSKITKCIHLSLLVNLGQVLMNLLSLTKTLKYSLKTINTVLKIAGEYKKKKHLCTTI